MASSTLLFENVEVKVRIKICFDNLPELPIMDDPKIDAMDFTEADFDAYFNFNVFEQ